MVEKSETLSSGTKHTYNVPVYAEYGALLELLFGPKGQTPARKAHREKLFGVDYPFTAPDIYTAIGTAHDLGLSYTEYLALDIHIKAKLIARYKLANMIEVLKRNAEIIAENNKKHQEGASAKAK